MLPKSLNISEDSFNSDLLVRISITASDAEYIDEYTLRLREAIETFRAAALKDLDRWETCVSHAAALIENSSYRKFKEEQATRPKRYADRFIINSFFEGDDQVTLGNLLAVVALEMGGIPKPYRYWAKRSDGTLGSIFDGEHPHWTHVQDFGKNKLVPYLGLLNTEIAVALFVLLMLEHPKLNVESLMRAKLFNERGENILISDASEGGLPKKRLTVDKGRAGEDKSVILTELSARVIQRVIEWTARMRQELREKGREDEAQWLWVGLHMTDFRIFALSIKAFSNSFDPNLGNRALGERKSIGRMSPFLSRHPELHPWIGIATFKSLRVSGGVLTFLESGGDLVATAEAFGHKDIQTTIEHYVPTQLRLAIYERQVRRHQALLVLAGAPADIPLAGITEFKSHESIQGFLNSELNNLPRTSPFFAALMNKIDRTKQNTFITREADTSPEKSAPKSSDNELLLPRSAKGLGIAFLYREHLRKGLKGDLPSRDRVAAEFWCEFVDALKGPLPMALHDLRSLVRDADRWASCNAGKVLFSI